MLELSAFRDSSIGFLHMAIAAGSEEPIGTTRLLQSNLALLLGPVEPLEFRQGEIFLELDRAAGHGRDGIRIPLCVCPPPQKCGRRGTSWTIKLGLA